MIYIEEHLEVVKHRLLIVSLVIVLGVCPVCPAAALFTVRVAYMWNPTVRRYQQAQRASPS